ncbi:Uncharacterised protein [Myroides odoratimimus]|nr:Uncharacterised protein [Myroides odoratimimus]
MDAMDKNAYIPGILATGKFDKAKIVKVLIEEEMEEKLILFNSKHRVKSY